MAQPSRSGKPNVFMTFQNVRDLESYMTSTPMDLSNVNPTNFRELPDAYSPVTPVHQHSENSESSTEADGNLLIDAMRENGIEPATADPVNPASVHSSTFTQLQIDVTSLTSELEIQQSYVSKLENIVSVHEQNVAGMTGMFLSMQNAQTKLISTLNLMCQDIKKLKQRKRKALKCCGQKPIKEIRIPIYVKDLTSTPITFEQTCQQERDSS
jgi:hypothetical protein